MALLKKFFLKTIPVFVCVFSLLSSTQIFAQKPISKNYKIENGLLSNEAHFTFSDSKGYLWVATDAGLCRFDGYKFKTFSIEDGMKEGTVLKIYEDKKGRIWFITISSFVGYILNNQVHNLEHSFKKTTTSSVQENFAYSIYVDEFDNLWVGTIFSGLIFKCAPPYIKKPEVISMKRDFVLEFNEKGDYIFGTYTPINGQFYVKNYKFRFSYIQKWKKTEKNYEFPPADYSARKNIVRRSPTEFFFGGRYTIWYLRNGKFNSIIEKNISFFKLDQKGGLWVGIENNGIYHYPDPNKLDVFNHDLKSNYYTSICTDLEGGYWLSSIFNGVEFIPDFDFKSILNKKEISETYNWQDNQLISLEKSGKIVLLENDQLKRTFPLRNIYHIMPFLPEKKVFIASLNHKYGSQDEHYIDLNSDPPKFGKNSFAKGLQNEIANIMKHFTTGKQFYGSANFEIIKYNQKKQLEKIFVAESRINDFWVEDDEVIWMASNSGLMSYDLKSKKLIRWGEKFQELAIRLDLISMDKNGKLWLGTRGSGLIQFNKKDKIKLLNKKTGLSSNFIRVIQIDDENVLWLATNIGLSKIDLNKQNQVTDYTFLNSFNLGTINDLTRMKDGLYVSSSKGLFRFSVAKLKQKKKKNPVPIYITDVSTPTHHDLPNYSEIDYYQSAVKFNFNAISYSHLKNVNYFYMIKGLDKKWNTTKNTTVNYQNLGSGDYTFLVGAKSDLSGQKMKTASFSFTVLSPFWEKWWFIGLNLLFFFSLIYLLFKLRLNTLANREREKAKLHISIAEMEAKALRSQMNPHFMFNSFNSIQSYILQNESKLANYYLGKFSKLMRQILESSKHDKTSLSDEIDLLSSYLELEKMRHNDQFDFEIRFEGKVDTGKIGIPIMLIQPHIENAVLHGLSPLKERAGKLNIDFECVGSYLKCVVEDNGIGREAAEKINRSKRRFHQSISTSLTNERLELYNKIHHTDAKIEYLDLYDERNQPTGTKVLLLIPIIKLV